MRRERGSLPVVLATGYSEQARLAADEGFAILREAYGMRDLDECVDRSAGRAARPRIAWGGFAAGPIPSAPARSPAERGIGHLHARASEVERSANGHVVQGKRNRSLIHHAVTICARSYSRQKRSALGQSGSQHLIMSIRR